METPVSFAPLAARLAAAAAEIRPVDGAEVSWANFMALFVCALLEMLICLCEALDARAAAEAARAVAAPTSRNVEASTVPAPRAGRQAPLGGKRASRLALVPDVHALAPKPDDAPSRATERPTPAAPRLVWSRDPGPVRAVHAPPWQPRRETRPSRLPSSTPILLRYRNYIPKWRAYGCLEAGALAAAMMATRSVSAAAGL